MLNKMSATTLGVIYGEITTGLVIVTKTIAPQSVYQVVGFAFVGGIAGALGSLFIKKGLPYLIGLFTKNPKK
jgi:hypothetical protein